ncbi:MAG TPA: sugar ABC transporter ATP-binding protein [Ktedonobacteraceae bacterium]
MQQNNPLLQMEHITKHFPGSVALADASIHVEQGEVHALVGENGAGKSTLIKVLTGVYQRDEGTILFDEHPRAFQSPQHAQREGISTIYQEINLIPFGSVTENIFLGREIFRWGLLNWRKMNAEASVLLERLHLALDVTKPLSTEQVLLTATGMREGRKLQNASLQVHAGEIVGLAGLLGSGRSEVARAIFGADALDGGTISLDGKETHFHTPADAMRAGIGFCSEDRKVDGIIPDLSVRENLTLAALPTLTRSGVVDRKQQEEIVDRFIQRLGIKTAGPEQKIRELSGGNQQKVLLARWLCLNPRLLLLDEPTRGIDVGAKGEIQKLVEELAEAGMGVLLISSELEEIIEGSDHVVVLRDGITVAEMAREGLSQDAILSAMAHGQAQTGEGESA